MDKNGQTNEDNRTNETKTNEAIDANQTKQKEPKKPSDPKEPSKPTKLSSAEVEKQLMELVRAFIAEFKTERSLSDFSIHTTLDKDLGIDSLGRVELFLRIEKHFAVYMPDTVMAQAESLKDISKAILEGHPAHQSYKREYSAVLKGAEKDPFSSRTLVEALWARSEQDPERPHIYFQNEDGSEKIIRYGQLLEKAGKVAGGLQAIGVRRGHTVAIMLPTCEDFFYALFGILLAGGIPVPIYPPIRADKIEEYAVREAGILNNAEVRVLITFSEAESLSKLLRVFIKSLHTVTHVKSLFEIDGKFKLVPLSGEDPALIQYTSGSTSAPKGVLLSHYNLLSNIRSAGSAVNITSKDAGVSWLPLYHDMGLIGSWFCSLYYAMPITIMSPISFLNRPERWLWAIHYHRATISAGPNFAYELCVRKIEDSAIEGLDLSSWRLAFNGAEPINPKTMARFIKKFKPYGFKPEAMYPVYGLAENSVALAFSPMGRPPLVDVIARDPFELENKAVFIRSISVDGEKEKINSDSEEKTLQFVACGKPIPDHDIRIVDENNREVTERTVGSIQFSGPSAMMGYYQNREATQAIFVDGWWDTGDYGYMASGEVYITGRKKDLIIKAGRNLYPQEIEDATYQVNGIRKGCVIAFGVSDHRLGTEKLVVVAETLEKKLSVRNQMIDEVIESVYTAVGVPPDEVILVEPRTIPKTSSGKLQRSACKKMYINHELSKKGLPVWVQMTKLFFKGGFVTLNRKLYKVFQYLYTIYAALLVLITFPFIYISTFFCSKEKLGKLCKLWSKFILAAIFCRISIEGKKHLKPKNMQKMIYVANHTSYVDSIILLSILPSGILFVAKEEVFSWKIVGRVVKKLGFLPVNRLDFSKSIEETNQITKALKEGQSIMIYPEGTFSYAAGLRPFKLGAFKVASDTDSALCPIAMQGSRHLLRGDNWLLNISHIDVWVGKPIKPEANDWNEVTRLHSVVRKAISEHCGEQSLDLAAATPVTVGH